MNPERSQGPPGNNNYPTTPNTAFQQVYGNQQGYFPQGQQQGQQQQQQQQQGFANFQAQGAQQQQFAQQQFQQQQYQQQQQQQQQFGQQQPQFNNAYDANGLARQLQNQHLTPGQGAAAAPGGQRPRTSGSSQASGSVRDDYVMFQRDDTNFNPSTKERAKALKLKVELHYNQSVAHAVERNQRFAY
jgi:protein-serine/threonine kinase